MNQPPKKIEPNKIHCLNALEGLKKLPNESIDCIVTSPPSWRLRDYRVPKTRWLDGESEALGMEQDFRSYLDHLLEIFNEMNRVLKSTGTLWVNLGDTYAGDWRNYKASLYKNPPKNLQHKNAALPTDRHWNPANRPPPSFPQSVKKKSLCLIPERFTIGMLEQGWVLRNRIVWHKPNHTPSSVKDRFSCSWEYLFLFSKSPKYYFDLDAVRIPHKASTLQRRNYRWKAPRSMRDTGVKSEESNMCHPLGKNPGDCWQIMTRPFREAHFAVYPEELCERPIRAGCPSKVCMKCGTPQLTRKAGESANAFNIRVRDAKKGRLKNHDRKATDTEIRDYKEKDYVSQSREKVIFSCDCKAGFSPGVVLDPFMGSGTTAVVAKRLGRQFIGFELNPAYVEMAIKRLSTIKSSSQEYSQNAA